LPLSISGSNCPSRRSAYSSHPRLAYVRGMPSTSRQSLLHIDYGTLYRSIMKGYCYKAGAAGPCVRLDPKTLQPIEVLKRPAPEQSNKAYRNAAQRRRAWGVG
jgi:hypothetical protein